MSYTFPPTEELMAKFDDDVIMSFFVAEDIMRPICENVQNKTMNLDDINTMIDKVFREHGWQVNVFKGSFVLYKNTVTEALMELAITQ
jgi:hypothetical protein